MRLLNDTPISCAADDGLDAGDALVAAELVVPDSKAGDADAYAGARDGVDASSEGGA